MKAPKVSNEPYPKVSNNTDNIDLLINRAISLEGLPTKASSFERGLPTRVFIFRKMIAN